MKRRILGIVLSIFFAALIAMPVVIKRFSERQVAIGAAPHRDTSDGALWVLFPGGRQGGWH